VDEQQSSLFMVAIQRGVAPPLLDLMLERGASPLHPRPSDGLTGMLLAVMMDRGEVMDVMLEWAEEGGKMRQLLRSRNWHRSTPLSLAAEVRGRSQVEGFMEGGRCVRKPLDHCGLARWHLACSMTPRDGRVLTPMWREGKPSLTPSPRHSSPQLASAPLVIKLLEHGAEVQSTDNDGDTPLHCAALGGRLDNAKAIVAKAQEVDRCVGRLTSP
jgi:ankyrin repeat protein